MEFEDFVGTMIKSARGCMSGTPLVQVAFTEAQIDALAALGAALQTPVFAIPESVSVCQRPTQGAYSDLEVAPLGYLSLLLTCLTLAVSCS